LQKDLLPGVEKSVAASTVENWSGVQNRVDAVLFFNVLCHVHPADRRALFQKLMSQYLSDGGLVAVIDNVTTVPSGFLRLLERFGQSRIDFSVLEDELLSAGFQLVLKRDLKV